MRRAEREARLSRNAQAILKVLRQEWEMGTADLRDESGVTDRAGVHRGHGRAAGRDDRRPVRSFYQPKFTYIWTLGVGRLPDALWQRVNP